LYDRLNKMRKRCRSISDWCIIPDSLPDIDPTLYAGRVPARFRPRQRVGKSSIKLYANVSRTPFLLPSFWADATSRSLRTERSTRRARGCRDRTSSNRCRADCPTAGWSTPSFSVANGCFGSKCVQPRGACEADHGRIFPMVRCIWALPAEFWLRRWHNRQGARFISTLLASRFHVLIPRIEKRDEAWMSTVPLSAGPAICGRETMVLGSSLAKPLAHDYPRNSISSLRRIK